MLYEIVDERLPMEHAIGRSDSPSIHWEKVDHRYCSPDQRQAFILQKLGDYLDWPLATYEYPSVDNPHQHNVDCSSDYAKEMFLESKVYQAWKNRKIRGPGLLCATGAGLSTPPPFFLENYSSN